MNIIFWGTPEYSVESLNRIFESKHTLLAVVTQPDKKRSRGNKQYPTPVKKRALELGIKVLTPSNIKNDIDIQNELKLLNADIYIVVAFGQILPENVLEFPKYGSWNAHGSLLPKWRGAAPIQRSILEGDSITGVGIMYMEKGLDTGPILIQEKTPININQNFMNISLNLSLISAELIIKSIDIIEKAGICSKDNIQIDLKLTDQSSISNTTSYASIIRKDELRIDWNSKSIDIHRKIMALYPNAYSYWREKRIKILDSEILEFNDLKLMKININEKNLKAYKNGSIIFIVNSKAIIVKAKINYVMIKKIQIEGKKPVTNNNLIQQLKPNIGDNFNS